MEAFPIAPTPTPSLVLIDIVGGVCLLLWGLALLRLGVTRGFGAELHRFLARGTRNRLLGFFSGMGVTAALQSSMATTLIVASFAGQGMISVKAALAVVLGGDVGTTLVAQLLSVDMSWLAPALMVVGFSLFSVGRSGTWKNAGRGVVGLALMMFALMWIKDAAAPLKSSNALPVVFHSLQVDAVFAVLVAGIVTWVVHSSLAVVLLLVSLTHSGVVPVPLALVMILGANLGGTIAPVLATLRDTPPATRIAVGNLLIRLVGVLAALPFVGFIREGLEALDPDPARLLVNFHTGFNLALALCFLPLTGVVERLARKIVRDRVDSDDPGKPKYLDERALGTPPIALASAARETLRMADLVQGMLEDTIRALGGTDEKVIEKIRERDDVIDRIYSSLKRYMARLTQESLDPREAQRYMQILTFATNLEHSGDVIDKNLMPMALKKIRNSKSFSERGFAEIEHIHALVLDSVRLAQSIFISGDVDLARRLVEEKEIIRLAEIKGSTAHIERLREGVPESIATSSLHLDIIRDLRRINTYMCPVAYSILEEKGQLRETRLIDPAERVPQGEGAPRHDASRAPDDFSGHWLE